MTYNLPHKFCINSPSFSKGTKFSTALINSFKRISGRVIPCMKEKFNANTLSKEDKTMNLSDTNMYNEQTDLIEKYKSWLNQKGYKFSTYAT